MDTTGKRLPSRYHEDVLSHKSSNSNSLSTRSSVYSPNIEKQLHSLVVEDDDTKEETEDLLQRTFDQLDIDKLQINQDQESKLSVKRPTSTLRNTHSFQSNTTEEEEDVQSSFLSNPSLNDDDTSSIMRDFSAFTCPFTESPVVLGRASTGFYLPTPTAIRSYLPYPDASILKQMKLPYPFRVKEPVSQRLERLESDSSFMSIANSQNTSRQQPRRKKNSRGSEDSRNSFIETNPPVYKTKRHSLDLGQVDYLLQKTNDLGEDLHLNPTIKKHSERSRSIISDRTVEEIMSWVPDKNTVWRDSWKDDIKTITNDKLSPPVSTNISKKDPNRIPPPLWQINDISNNNIDSQLHPLDILKK